jgi:type II secretion system protein N
MMNSTGKILLYGLYVIAAVCFFLYLLFPSQTISRMIVDRVSQARSDVRVDVKDAHPVFPPGLKLESLSVDFADTPIIRMPFIKIVPALFSMMGGEKHIAFNGPLGHGSLKGLAELTSEGQRHQTKVILNLTEVPLEAFEILRRWPNYQVAGDMTAYIDYDSRKGTDGTANVKLDIAPTKIVFNPPIMGLTQMEFTQLETEMTITPRILQIRRCEVSGSQIEGKITGAIIFRQPLQKSRLTLSCTLKPQPAFLSDHKNDMIGGLIGNASAQQRGIIFRISGTLDNPSYVVH